MIVDSSALVAILREEPEHSAFEKILDETDVLRISAATYLEFSIVIDSRSDPAMSREIDDLLDRSISESSHSPPNRQRSPARLIATTAEAADTPPTSTSATASAMPSPAINANPSSTRAMHFVHTDLRLGAGKVMNTAQNKIAASNVQHEAPKRKSRRTQSGLKGEYGELPPSRQSFAHDLSSATAEHRSPRVTEYRASMPTTLKPTRLFVHRYAGCCTSLSVRPFTRHGP